MELNEIFKKFVDTTIGMASTAAEKVGEFADNMSKKGQEFKESKKEDFDKFIGSMKEKMEETSGALSKMLHLKDQRVDSLETEVKALRKEVDALKAKIK
jgi:polyhydroxyalkanoate synthesis regulator phasin